MDNPVYAAAIARAVECYYWRLEARQAGIRVDDRECPADPIYEAAIQSVVRRTLEKWGIVPDTEQNNT